MSVFAVSFRIANQTSLYGSYSERWTSVDSAIQARAIGRNYWKQTTSFFALQSQYDTATALADAINQNSNFDPSMDLLLVINLSANGYKVLGVNSDDDLATIMSLR